jgi:hypothetical protein
VIATALRWAAILASAFVGLSFVMFAADQTGNASDNSIRQIQGEDNVKPESATKVPNPPRAIEKLREQENSSFHEFVDDVNDVLTSPFSGFVDKEGIWVQRLVVLALALLIYGLGGLYLARSAGLRRW